VSTGQGELLYEAPVTTTPAVSPATAFLVSSMLRDVVDAGTAAQSRSLGFRLPAAGKTGTTSDYYDAWFVGYTPSLATGVWVGYDQPRTIVNGGYAAQIAVPMWARFMKTVTAKDEPEWLRMPTDVVPVEIDSATGSRAAAACRTAGHVRVEYFAKGTEPIDICPLHRFDARRALASAPPVVTAASASRQAVAVVREEPPPAVVPAVREVVAAPAPPAPEEKKRGFWSRIFRRPSR
jgi:membrane carboxypeptidase/penicillin-binding protein